MKASKPKRLKIVPIMLKMPQVQILRLLLGHLTKPLTVTTTRTFWLTSIDTRTCPKLISRKLGLSWRGKRERTLTTWAKPRLPAVSWSSTKSATNHQPFSYFFKHISKIKTSINWINWLLKAVWLKMNLTNFVRTLQGFTRIWETILAQEVKNLHQKSAKINFLPFWNHTHSSPLLHPIEIKWRKSTNKYCKKYILKSNEKYLSWINHTKLWVSLRKMQRQVISEGMWPGTTWQS